MSEPATADTANPSGRLPGRLPALLLLALLVAVLIFAFRDSLTWMVQRGWQKEEYNHGYLIPFVAAFLIAVRSREFSAVPWNGSPSGLVLIGIGYLMLLLGQMSSVLTVSHFGFIVALWGCFATVLGWPAVKTIWPALAYLVFMVPMPNFLEVKLTAGLQLISTEIGVMVIRLASIPVYAEGNVIDLGAYQLAVDEACSGLRYLFPLMSFGFLCAVLFEAPAWQRVIVFASSVPLTVLMNSVRIGVIGILVNAYGVEQAEGFLHDFEGWVIFMVCVSIMFLMMYVMARFSGRSLLKSLRLDTPPTGEIVRLLGGQPARRSGAVAAAVVLAGTLLIGAVDAREDIVPARTSLNAFPLVLGPWRGGEQATEQRVLDVLEADDTILAIYQRDADPFPVALWMTYYSSQRGDRAVHSPSVCLPGGGWNLRVFEPVQVPDVRADGGDLPVNRVIIQMGDARQLVYYWFWQRGRMLTNEYLVKWYIFWDGLTRNRTDGGLVRLTTPIGEGADAEAEADRRLQEFVRVLDPKLAYYLPGEDVVARVAQND
jgi:exosortase D (VPLPA-CTERM-specific)